MDNILNAEILCLAVVWDEKIGPEIISICPSDVLGDPTSIALQIYLSSAAVFGQHQTTQRIDFSLPLLSISPNHLVRVAWNSWDDSDVRGDARPYYIAFIWDKETDRFLVDEFNNRIWSLMERFNEEKRNFDLKETWELFRDLLHRLKSGGAKTTDFILQKPEGDRNYTILQAVRDIERSNDLWQRKKDKTALSLAMKSAYRLEGNEPDSAGHAFFLAAGIFFQSTDLENALENFTRSADSFRTAKDTQNAAEALFNCAVIAFRLEKYDLAKSQLLLSSEVDLDSSKKARMYLLLAQTHTKLKEFDIASNSFEIAVENAIRDSNFKLAAEILSQFAFRLSERAQETKGHEIDTNLIEYSAHQRERAAEYLSKIGESAEAASNLVLASKVYHQLKNDEKVISLLFKSKDLFLLDNDKLSAARVLLDVLYIRKDKRLAKDLGNEVLSLIEGISDLDSKNRLLGQTYLELAKQSDGWERIDFYQKALKVVVTNDDFLKIGLSFSNYLYGIQEDYYQAGELFLEISKKLEGNKEQSTKSLRNAHLSFRRAATAYYQSGTTQLLLRRFSEAVLLYKEAFKSLKQAERTVGEEDRIPTQTLFSQVTKGIEQKLEFLEEDLRNEIRLMLGNPKQ